MFRALSSPLSTCAPDSCLQSVMIPGNTILTPDDEHTVLETCRGI